MKSLKIPLTKLTTDHSDWNIFKFTFFCDCCENGWVSPTFPFSSDRPAAIKQEDTIKQIWEQGRKMAFEQANLQAHLYFNNCSECCRCVCDKCFGAKTKKYYGLCKECSEKKTNKEFSLEKT
ncbi:MAG: hypothetical protein FWD87_02080 [Spirochaetaceae bacterium]|nr:hypothetical protein [Spirochaetaceae bacterium]